MNELNRREFLKFSPVMPVAMKAVIGRAAEEPEVEVIFNLIPGEELSKSQGSFLDSLDGYIVHPNDCYCQSFNLEFKAPHNMRDLRQKASSEKSVDITNLFSQYRELERKIAARFKEIKGWERNLDDQRRAIQYSILSLANEYLGKASKQKERALLDLATDLIVVPRVSEAWLEAKTDGQFEAPERTASIFEDVRYVRKKFGK